MDSFEAEIKEDRLIPDCSDCDFAWPHYLPDDWRPVIPSSKGNNKVHLQAVQIDFEVDSDIDKYLALKSEDNSKRRNSWNGNSNELLFTNCNAIKGDKVSYWSQYVAATKDWRSANLSVKCNEKIHFEDVKENRTLKTDTDNHSALKFEVNQSESNNLWNTTATDVAFVECNDVKGGTGSCWEQSKPKCEASAYVSRPSNSNTQGDNLIFSFESSAFAEKLHSASKFGEIGLSVKDTNMFFLSREASKIDMKCTSEDKTIQSHIQQTSVLVPSETSAAQYNTVSFLTAAVPEVSKAENKMCPDCISVTDSSEWIEAVLVNGHQYECDRCKKRFTQKSNLKVHINTVHGDGPKYECDQCSKKFTRKDNLKMHIDTVHDDGSKYECDRYSKKFTLNSNLKVHINTVHGDGPKYECDRCRKKFTQKSNLKVHIDTVHGDGPRYECDRCRKKFTLNSHLKMHIDTVHGDGPKYECDRCSKKFTLNSHLKMHIDTVHGDGPKYECYRCGKKFTRKSHLKRHLDIIHDEIPQA